MYTEAMLKSHPRGSSNGVLAETINALYACVQTCKSCADACLGEEHIADLRRCITLDLDCADVCEATAATLSRQTETDSRLRRTLIETCIEACRLCAEECERHAQMHEHCRICAEACRACEQQCQRVLQAVGAA